MESAVVLVPELTKEVTIAGHRASLEVNAKEPRVVEEPFQM